MSKQNILWIVVAVVIIASLAFWLWPPEEATPEAEEVSQSNETGAVSSVKVAPSANPLDAVTPENPLEKTNPFR